MCAKPREYNNQNDGDDDDAASELDMIRAFHIRYTKIFVIHCAEQNNIEKKSKIGIETSPRV